MYISMFIINISDKDLKIKIKFFFRFSIIIEKYIIFSLNLKQKEFGHP